MMVSVARLLFEHRYSEIGNWDISDHAKEWVLKPPNFWTVNYGVVQPAFLKRALVVESFPRAAF